MSEFTSRLVSIRRRLDHKEGEANALRAEQQRLLSEKEDLAKAALLYSKCSIVLNSLAETRQARVQQQIEVLVTEGLRSVFDEELSFHLISSVKANKQVVDMVIRSKLVGGQILETDILSARGGGISAVVGFLLRLIILLLTNKDKDKLLVLDETFSNLSEEYRPKVAEFIRQVVDKTNTQVILVSHFHDLTEPADKVYDFRLSPTGETIIKAVK